MVTSCRLVIISITRYRDIDRGFIDRTISWRLYIVRYRARTHVSRRRILCQSLWRAVSVPVRQTSNVPAAAWTRVSFSVFHTLQSSLQCTGQREQRSVKVTQTMHAARRPTARLLYPGRCVLYNIAIWKATIYRLACWATIWSVV